MKIKPLRLACAQALWVHTALTTMARGIYRGYLVAVVGRDEEIIRNYVHHQKPEDRRTDQLNLM